MNRVDDLSCKKRAWKKGKYLRLSNGKVPRDLRQHGSKGKVRCIKGKLERLIRIRMDQSWS